MIDLKTLREDEFRAMGMLPEAATKWAIWDKLASKWVSKPYSKQSRARARADALDNAYGAYRYSVREI